MASVLYNGKTMMKIENNLMLHLTYLFGFVAQLNNLFLFDFLWSIKIKIRTLSRL